MRSFLLPRSAQDARPDGRHFFLLLLDGGDAVAPPRVPPRDGGGWARRRRRDHRVPHQVLHHAAAAPAAPNHPADGRPPRLPDPRRRRVRLRHRRAPLLPRRPLARRPLRDGQRLVLRLLAAKAAVVAAGAAFPSCDCRSGVARDAEAAGPGGGGAATAAPHPAAGDGRRGCERRAGRRCDLALGRGELAAAAANRRRGVGRRRRRRQRQLAPRLQVLDPAYRPLHRAVLVALVAAGPAARRVKSFLLWSIQPFLFSPF